MIEVGSTFGSVAYLGARYASVRGRDGKEYLIPNENLITNEVINWSYSSPRCGQMSGGIETGFAAGPTGGYTAAAAAGQNAPSGPGNPTAFGVAYGSDLHAVRDLAVAVASRTDRVLASPRPVCHVSGFGDCAVDMLLRFWIEDPINGVTNIKGEVLLGLWDAFNEKRIEIPMPQREVHIRAASLSALSAVREAQTARD